MLKIIAALGPNNLIGKGNSLPWNIKSDLQHFKATTMGHTMIMGDKTYESMGGKPLKGRKSIVLSLNEYDPHSDDVEVVHDYQELVKRYGESSEIAYVIGGATIYRLFLPYVSELVVSRIKGNYNGDIYFPSFEKDFEVKSVEEREEFSIVTYQRRG
jgi:dihydrofolate reductase